MPEISIGSRRKTIYYLAYILPPGSPREKSEGLMLLRPFEWLSVCLTIDSACSLVFRLVEALSNIVQAYYVPTFVDVGATVVLILQIVGEISPLQSIFH